ncbi:siphovirus ReqiPepy6 Gp37-like family protein [Lachnospiraceae bacterium ZAX-1]
MEFLIAGSDMHEVGYLKDYSSLDFDLAERNDFLLKTYETIPFGSYIFCPGTEWGGVVEGVKRITDTELVEISGTSWRGLLGKDVVVPFSGQDYRTVSGDANQILATILSENDSVGTIFNVPTTASGATFINYKFDRYISKLDGFKKMLKTKGYRLHIWAQENGSGNPFSICCEAVPIVDYTNKLNYSSDYDITLTIDDYRGGINHLICLGSGDLAERQRIDLYVQQDGTISDSGAYYTGSDMRTSVYEYSSAESIDDLRSYGIKKLEELSNYKKLSMEVEDFGVEIGDIVGAQDSVTGIKLSKPVAGKILRASGGDEQIEIKVEGGTDADVNY